MRYTASVLVLLIGAVAAACSVKADVMRLDSVRRAPTDPDSIEIVLEEPTRPYRRIAIVNTSDQGWDLPIDKLREKLVAEAAWLGGEAVIIGMPESESSGAVVVPIGNMWYAGTTKEKKLVGIVILWESSGPVR